MSKIILDMALGRVPKTMPDTAIIDRFDEVIVVVPIWMSKVASPLRPYLLRIKKRNQPYKFLSISGGALNKNPKLADDLSKYGGDNILLTKVMYISDLLANDNSSMKETSDYKLSEDDLDTLEAWIMALT